MTKNDPGYKFETLSLLPKPWAETSREQIEGREDVIVSNHAQYCSVCKTGIGKTKIVLGGEIDAVWDCKPSDNSPINWVELKTSAAIESDRDMLGIEELETSKLPGLVKRNGKGSWDGTICINFAAAFLDC